eukprot:TRINITY_DN10894_c0_g6_i1.p1 TRINITY_DN10894_c0_g6~~TRINITY_DN10894_c0_g6_i1.p1  ORF type:complete len:250 (+),score=10.87 TRINITY_DN10894_c0_g6_i1:53-751(+)
MSAPSQLRTTYFNPSLANPQLRIKSEWERNIDESQRRILFSGVGYPSESSSTHLNFHSNNLNSMLHAKPELRDSWLDMADTEANNAKKRRPEQDLQQHQMGSSYVLQPSGSQIPVNHGQIPGTVWMVTNPNNQGMSGDPIWTLPSLSNTTMYRGSMSSGLHFMNFPAPMALLPSQQLNSGMGGGATCEGHLGMLAALNAYRPLAGGAASEQPPTRSNQHDEGNERHDASSPS